MDRPTDWLTLCDRSQNLLEHLFPEALKEVTIAGKRPDITRKIDDINKADKKSKRGKKKSSLGLSAEWDSTCCSLAASSLLRRALMVRVRCMHHRAPTPFYAVE